LKIGADYRNTCLHNLIYTLYLFTQFDLHSQPNFPTFVRSLINVEPHLMNVEPHLMNVEPTLMNVEPTLINVEPTLMNVEPHLINVEPTLINVVPHFQRMVPHGIKKEASQLTATFWLKGMLRNLP